MLCLNFIAPRTNWRWLTGLPKLQDPKQRRKKSVGKFRDTSTRSQTRLKMSIIEKEKTPQKMKSTPAVKARDLLCPILNKLKRERLMEALMNSSTSTKK